MKTRRGRSSSPRRSRGDYSNPVMKHPGSSETQAGLKSFTGAVTGASYGSVQSFGAMVILQEYLEGAFVVQMASDNSETVLGHSPDTLFALQSFSDLLNDDQVEIFSHYIDLIQPPVDNRVIVGPAMFELTIDDRLGISRRLWCSLHANPLDRNTLICEFELQNDHMNPLNAAARILPAGLAGTSGHLPKNCRKTSVFDGIYRPLRILPSTRKGVAELTAMEAIRIVDQIQNQLGSASTVEALLEITVSSVRDLTGFSHVVVTKYESETHALISPALTESSFMELAIPHQAQKIPHAEQVWLVYDQEQTNSRMICRDTENAKHTLDMSCAYLRAMSPSQVNTLRLNKIRSFMSVNIIVPHKVWGVISCRSYEQFPMRAPLPVRKICLIICNTLARNIERLSYAPHLPRRAS
ncbi:hypothetical protein ASPACDRAFT_61117 [Aspergillus aculeatus ATCC 16872]|uniref:Phytochrome chromophore attachment site domain-containing protein n=1 Tax=Aspergillus aculeatus (strain ATCC 16872 / CBS 172.66 / WB 5094) TaxID=690307 RepID=A0A1L9WT76_ASPA1|nr:uncharacterized protein ASPACDRAFT_61117 [Aspergillus aculeatus ATCC 16872]OJJ99332.1 hypothetical protein ASPACDRAFT_61117 [Aspergillus aculeatus ATCC 16872]